MLVRVFGRATKYRRPAATSARGQKGMTAGIRRMTGTTTSCTSGVMGIDVPVDLPDKVVLAVGTNNSHGKLHIPHPRREKYCYRKCREHKEKPIEVYPPGHRRWCQLCVQLQWEDYSMMRDDILDYVDSHPDATPKEVAENVEGANPYTVRTVLDGEGIEPTEPEDVDGEDAGEAGERARRHRWRRIYSIVIRGENHD